MILCLVRHAKAEERGLRWPDDRLRPLSPKGRQRMQQAALGLSRLFEPAAIVSSPLVRAAQTAEILRSAFNLPGLVFSESLAVGDPDATLREIERQSDGDLIVVGHEPDMSALLSVLLAGAPNAVRARFGTGTAALVECSRPVVAGQSTLVGLFQNRVLRRLGSATG